MFFGPLPASYVGVAFIRPISGIRGENPLPSEQPLPDAVSAQSAANGRGYIDRDPIVLWPPQSLTPFAPSSLGPLVPYPPTRKLALTWKTALTIAKAMKPTKTKTPMSTPLAMTLVKRFSCAEICR